MPISHVQHQQTGTCSVLPSFTHRTSNSRRYLPNVYYAPETAEKGLYTHHPTRLLLQRSYYYNLYFIYQRNEGTERLNNEAKVTQLGLDGSRNKCRFPQCWHCLSSIHLFRAWGSLGGLPLDNILHMLRQTKTGFKCSWP